MRLHIHVTGLLAVLAFSASSACGGEQPEAESPTKVTTTKTPVEEPKPVASTSATTSVDPPAPKLTMSEMQKKSIAGMVAAFNAHDAKKLASFYANDALVRSPGATGWKDETGRDAVEKSHAGLFTNVPDSKIGTVRVLLKGDVAIWEWIAIGTDSVGMEGDKPTNKQVGFQAASVMWFDDTGMVKTDHTYFDPGTIAGQLGKLPKDAKVRPVSTLPAGDGVWIESKGADSEAKNLELLKQIYGTLEKGDEKGFLALLDDKGVHVSLSQPNDIVGKDAAKKEFGTYKKAFGDTKFNAEQAWGIGDLVVAEVTTSGMHKGPMGPFKATNKKITMHSLDVSEISNGKFVKMTTYGNSAEMIAQVAPPKKDAAPKDKDPKKDPPKK